ncbi:MAG TPA: histidine kinase [Nitrospirota bacterium]|nr:histidine kinase [Nitrospirota bacterium]
MEHSTASLHAGKQYVPQRRAERLIATGRMILSAFFLLAIWIDPSEPSRYARLTYAILAGYLIYSLLLGVMTLKQYFNKGRLHVVTHAIDMLVFALLMFLTEGSTSPFFVYFIFLLVCATLRWQRRGTLWTAVTALAVVIFLAWFPSNLLHDQNFELNRFIIRVVYLAVVAVLLGYLGEYEQSMSSVFSKLAGWPRSVSDDPQSLSCEILGHAATILNAPRVVLAWEEAEEPWLHLASWSRDGCQYRREPPAVFGTLVAEQLSGTSFFCQNAGDPQSPVIHSDRAGLRRWQGTPLDPELQKNFAVRAILASRFTGEKAAGYLLSLDKTPMTADDLVLGGIVANEVAGRLDRCYLVKQQQEAAASNERIRLARDLHDGLLQSLTGAALQLETAHRLMETEPQTAGQRIREIQRLLASEQRDLRSHINELRPFPQGRPARDFELTSRLEELAERIRRQWDLSVEITTAPAAPRIAMSMAREVYFVVHEALINAVRHAGASHLRAGLAFKADRVHITVADDGHGFSFRGNYDQDALFAMKRGPVTLKERIAALRGTLAIESREDGARLEIILPLTERGG